MLLKADGNDECQKWVKQVQNEHGDSFWVPTDDSLFDQEDMGKQFCKGESLLTSKKFIWKTPEEDHSHFGRSRTEYYGSHLNSTNQSEEASWDKLRGQLVQHFTVARKKGLLTWLK